MRQKELRRYILQLDDLVPVLVKHFQISNPHKLYGIKLTLQQYLALDTMAKKGRCMITDLSKNLGIALSTATELVDRLTKRRFVKRKKDLKDRRVIWVNLTNAGVEIYKKINVKKQRQVAVVLKKLTQRDRNALINILGVVSQAVERTEIQRAKA
ncbi:MAG: MarR family transcriptional regulator [Candidatus Omnitrophica bacterium]|nr:MarR family transcriptional regulator [Candidatus Omnitrophota bacterium]